jgi:hypothetical protein
MSIRLTLRDLELLQVLFTARFLTTVQLQRLFWQPSKGGMWGPKKDCERRLRQLTQAGLVQRIERPVKRGEVRLPYIYTLAKGGKEVLVAELGIPPEEIDWRTTNDETYAFLAHTLQITDVWLAVRLACAHAGVTLGSWVSEREFRSEGTDYVLLTGPEGQEEKAAVVPDAVFTLVQGTRRGLFFVEVDRRTTTIAPTLWERRGWRRKVQAYTVYQKSQAYQERYGAQRARILTITTSSGRLTHLKQATERVLKQAITGAQVETNWTPEDQNEFIRMGKQFGFATFDQTLDEGKFLRAPIWYVAGAGEPVALLP